MAEVRVRICLATGELEVEGTPDFVGTYDKSIRAMLRRLEEQPAPATSKGTPQGATADSSGALAGTAERDFGEVLHGLPKSATGTDQILLAGHFASQSSGDKSFSTGDANRLLVGQGVKLSNAAQAMRGNLTAKRVFKVGGNRWRISRQGEDHLRTLLPDL
jgi:hypothetical protein